MAANNDLVDYYYSDALARFVPITSVRSYDATNGSITCSVAKQGMFGSAAVQPTNALFTTVPTVSSPPTQAEVNVLINTVNALIAGLKTLGIVKES